jgi:hypothetical protein
VRLACNRLKSVDHKQAKAWAPALLKLRLRAQFSERLNISRA